MILDLSGQCRRSHLAELCYYAVNKPSRSELMDDSWHLIPARARSYWIWQRRNIYIPQLVFVPYLERKPDQQDG